MKQVLITGEQIKDYLNDLGGYACGINVIGDPDIIDFKTQSVPFFHGYDGTVSFTVTAKIWLYRDRSKAGFGLLPF